MECTKTSVNIKLHALPGDCVNAQHGYVGDKSTNRLPAAAGNSIGPRLRGGTTQKVCEGRFEVRDAMSVHVSSSTRSRDLEPIFPVSSTPVFSRSHLAGQRVHDSSSCLIGKLHRLHLVVSK